MNNNKLKIKAFSNFGWGFAEKLGAKLIGMIVTVVLARLLDPEHYSIISIVSIFLSICEIFVEGGFSSALIQKKDPDTIDYSSVLFLSLGISMILYAIMFFSAPLISRIYHEEILILAIRILSIKLIINALYSVEMAYISNALQFKKYFFTTLIGTIISAIIGIYMAYQGFGTWALITQQISNSVINTFLLFFVSGLRIQFAFSFSRIKGLFGFGSKILLSTFITGVYTEIRPLLVGIKFKNTDLAYFSKGNMYPSLLYNILRQPLSSVLFPVMSKAQSDDEYLLKIYRRFVSISTFLIFPLMFGLASISKNFVIVLLTEKWLPIVPYMKVFSILYIFDIINLGAVQAVKAKGKGNVVLIMEILKRIGGLLIIFLFVIFSNQPIWIAISCLVSSFWSILVNTYVNVKNLGYRYKNQIMDVLPNLIPALIMGFLTLKFGELQLNTFLLLFLQIFLGIIIYFAISLIINRKNLFYFLNMVKQTFLKKKI